YLERQISLLRPKIVVVLGRIAAQSLLATETPISRLRGQVQRFGPEGIPLVVTYHPAYLLRNPIAKRESWRDLRLALATLGNRT
ncbi:phage SPO1 DNA polymerase-related protein, partial [mine drainage metagenome]